MKRFLAPIFVFLICVSTALAWSAGDIPSPNSSAMGVVYSPRHFTATIEQASTREAFATNKIVVSGGNTANYTTAECERVVVYSSIEAISSRIYTPTTNRFSYAYPTLEVENATFHYGDFIRVEFLDSMIANNITIDRITFEAADTFKSYTFSSGDVVSLLVHANGAALQIRTTAATSEPYWLIDAGDDFTFLPGVKLPKNTTWYFMSAGEGSGEVVYGWN